MADLEVQTRQFPDRSVCLELKGFLDAHTFGRLDGAIAALFKQGIYRIVVDLSKVGYIGSAGAGVFIGALGKVRDQQGDLVLLNPSVPVREVLELLGLHQIFRIAASLDEARAFFGPAA